MPTCPHCGREFPDRPPLWFWVIFGLMAAVMLALGVAVAILGWHPDGLPSGHSFHLHLSLPAR